MVKRDVLINFIHDTLGRDLLDKVQTFDRSANGVQVHGKDEVNKVVLGVSANLNFLKEAVASGADFTLTHHGLNLSDKYVYNARLDPAAQARLRFVFQENLTVAGYHATLDIHPELGNNATIIKLIGAKRLDIPYHEGWGWVGEFTESQDVEELAEKCSKLFEHDVFAVYGGPRKVKRIGVCSGGAKPVGETLFEILEKNIDLHIAGEIVEGGDALAMESGFNYFACGHYATEVFGVQELGKAIKSQFKDKLEVEFIDIPSTL